jgi:prepilin-type N-terminal cleavage/methylation domain-containing protein
MDHQARRRAARGFTLIELLIVVLMIGVLATLVIPRYRMAEMKAQGADVTTRASAINVCLKEYETEHDSVPSGTGPIGAPPSWLVPYCNGNPFSGPGSVTFQYARSDLLSPPTLLVVASSPDDIPIILAAAGGLGNIANVFGGGTSMLVTLTQ